MDFLLEKKNQLKYFEKPTNIKKIVYIMCNMVKTKPN